MNLWKCLVLSQIIITTAYASLWQDLRGVSAFRAGDYERAAALFMMSNQADGYYNAGNAYAYLGRYKEALKAYDKALAMNRANQDARYNRQLIEALLKKQQKQQSQAGHKKEPKPDIKPAKQEEKPQEKLEKTPQQQSTDQWLNTIPDDPGGLLREKFLRDYLRRRGES